MLQPMFARVLLKRERLEKKGSIVIPEEYKERYASLKCQVLAKGPTADESVEVGSFVIIGKYAGTWLDENGNMIPEGEYYICADEDILAKVTE